MEMKSLLKYKFMVEFDLPEIIDQSFIQLIPDQRLKIAHYFDQNILISYTLNQNRTKLWGVFQASSFEEVNNHITDMPLAKYMKWEVHELMFHESQEKVLPHFSLN